MSAQLAGRTAPDVDRLLLGSLTHGTGAAGYKAAPNSITRTGTLSPEIPQPIVQVPAAVLGAVLAAVFTVGSGGAPVSPMTTQAPSGIAPIVVIAPRRRSEAHGQASAAIESVQASADDAVKQVVAPVFASTAEQIDFVRDALSLTVTQLAQIAGVSRPTIYAWAGGQEPRSDDDRRRLNDLAAVAAAWTTMSTQAVGSVARMPVWEGASLLDLLVAPTLDRKKISRALEAVRDMQQRANSELLNRPALSIADIATAHGFAPRTEAQMARSVRDSVRKARRVP